MLQVNAEKMSKSLGNFLLLHEVLEDARPEALRMLMLQTHYRSPLDFSTERMDEADAALSRIENALSAADWACANAMDGAPDALDGAALRQKAEVCQTAFTEAMDDDFNAPAALGTLFTLVTEMNSALADKTLSLADAEAVVCATDAIRALMGVLGIPLTESQGETEYPLEVIALAADVAGYGGADAMEAVEALIEARALARSQKDWAKADAVRDGLIRLGFVIEDTPQGAKVTFEG